MNGRKRPVSIELNVDELYLLRKRVIWKIDRFLKLKYHVYGNDKVIIKKIKSCVKLLDKLCNIDNVKPFLKDITVRLTASEIALIWEVFSKFDGEYENMLVHLGSEDDALHNLINAINVCDIFYKDLDYSQKVYIYLYTEFAIAMRDSGNQNVYIDGPLLRVRSTYIYSILSNYAYIYEFKDIDTPDLHVSFFVNEPRYEKIGGDKISLRENFKYNEYSLFKITLKDLHKAQDTLNNSNIDYEYIANLNSDIEEDNGELLDELDCIINDANNLLSHSDYGPGWRLNLHFYDCIDIDGNYIESFDLEEEIWDRLNEIDFVTPDAIIVEEEKIMEINSIRIKKINEQKEKLNQFYSSIQYF